jgi:membrane protein DedA with SNARE-associated domain
MTIAEGAEAVLGFIRNNQTYAIPIIFILSFGESLAFVSLLLPATVILWGVGAIIGAGGLSFWPIYFAAVFGAALGDWLSYWLGYHFHDPISRMWPLSRHPDLLPRAEAVFKKWGALGIFFGRFLGPLRAAVPLVAGACRMPTLPFQAANWGSAFIWGFTTLAPGAFGVEWLRELFG